MITIQTDNNKNITIKQTDVGFVFGNKEIKPSILEINSGKEYNVLIENQSFRINVLSYNLETKELKVQINGKSAITIITTELDLLIQKMGFSGAGAKKITDLKAPMPGLIKNIKVTIGDSVKKGDALLVLEAMKMENNIKAQADGKVSQIAVKEGQAVEKGQLMIKFD